MEGRSDTPGSGVSAIDIHQGRFHEAEDEKVGFYHRPGRKKEGVAMEAGEGGGYPSPPRMEGKKDSCSSEEERGCTKLLVSPKSAKVYFAKLCQCFLFYSFCYSKHAC